MSKRSGDSKTTAAYKTRAPSLIKKSWEKGKQKLAVLHGAATCRVTGVAEASRCDQEEEYAGEIAVVFNDRFSASNAIGVNVAKCVDESGEITPGRIVSQRHVTGTTAGVMYRAVYLNGESENLDEIMLRHYSGVFASASMRPENPIKPLVVRMMQCCVCICVGGRVGGRVGVCFGC